MEMSCRLCPFAGVVGWGRFEVGWGEATRRAGFRSTMRGGRAGFGWDPCVGSAAGGVSRRQVAAHSINRAFGAVAPRHRDLRAHPPTDLAALVCRALRAVRGF